MRLRHRAVSLIRASVSHGRTYGLAPLDRVAGVAGMAKINRLSHLRYEALDQHRIAAKAVAGKDQLLAANRFALAIWPLVLEPDNPAVLIAKQCVYPRLRHQSNR